MTAQLSLLKPLAASLARARFAHYEDKRRAWVDHVEKCERCQRRDMCQKGAALRAAFLSARQTPIGERLP